MAIAAVTLEFIDGPERGRAVRISHLGLTLLGRGVDADITLPAVDGSVSRHQAYVELSRDCCVISRVAGSNRVVEVNHRGVDLQCTLADLDVVRLGQTVLRVALALTDTACLICGKTVDNGSQLDNDDHYDISILAHEGCIDLAGSNRERFGEYEACQLIDDSATGQMYQVYDVKAHRIWALNRLSVASQSHQLEFAMQQLLAIRHPNIIRCVQGGVAQDGVPFLVMEFARGGNIADFVGRGDNSPNGALQLIDDVLEALKFLHGLGKAHGNLHPRGIVIQREVRGFGVRWRAKLVDHGFTNGLRSNIPAISTLQWYPPDHRSDQHEQRDDIYAAAAILCSLLAHQLPSAGLIPARKDSASLRSETTCPWRFDVPTIRQVVASVLDRACHKDPSKRFRSAQELQDALREGSSRC